jgi:hypothetical protein
MGHVVLKSRRERRDPGIMHSDFGDPDMVTVSGPHQGHVY